MHGVSMHEVKVGAIITGASGVVLAAVRAVADGVPAPTSVWPTTVFGWVSGLVALTSFIGWMMTVLRSPLKPLEKAMADGAAHFDRKIVEMRDHFDEKIADTERGFVKDLDYFRSRVTGDLNGFGARLDGQYRDHEALEKIVAQLALALAESKRDREYLAEGQRRIESTLVEYKRERGDFERRLFDTLAARPGGKPL